MPYELRAIDKIGGAAIVRFENRWKLVSESSGWRAVTLEDESAAIRSTLSGAFTSSGYVCETLEEIVSIVRAICGAFFAIPDVSLAEIESLCPESIRRSWAERDEQKRHVRHHTEHPANAAYQQLWKELVALASRYVRPVITADDLATTALLVFFDSQRYSKLKSFIEMKRSSTEVLDTPEFRIFRRDAVTFFARVQRWWPYAYLYPPPGPFDWSRWWYDWPWYSRRYRRELGFLSIERDLSRDEFIDEKSLPPSDELSHLERQEALHEALRRLTPRQAALVKMRYVEGLTFREIASRLEHSASKVQRDLDVVIWMLRDILGSFGFDDPS